MPDLSCTRIYRALGARPALALPEVSGAGSQPGTGGKEMGISLLSPTDSPTRSPGSVEAIQRHLFFGII